MLELSAVRHAILALGEVAHNKFIRVFTDNTATAAVLNSLYARSPAMRQEVLIL